MSDEAVRAQVATETAAREAALAGDDWGTWLMELVLVPVATVGTPLFLFSIVVFFVTQAFQVDLDSGLRSLAAALLPLMVVTFLFKQKREVLRQAGDARGPISFLGSVIIGVGLMFVMAEGLRGVPIGELLFAACFGILVYGRAASTSKDKIASSYYGVLFGLLAYVILWGFPPID